MKNTRQTLQAAGLAALLAGHSHATVTTYAEFHLGEAGSLLGANRLPQDSSGNNRHFASAIGGDTIGVSASAVTAPGSSAYIDTRATSPNQGWYSTSTFSGLATDNFAIGVYAAAPSKDGTARDVISLGGADGAFKLSLAANGWGASCHNRAWIGAPNGAVDSFKPNQWVHLALIRKAGVTTFYIDGVAQAGTYANAPTHNSPHLSVNPGGTIFFNGRIDEARIVTFDPADAVPDIFAALGAPPLPIRHLIQDGEVSYPAVALAAGETSEVRPGSGGDRDFTTIVDPDAFTVASPHTLKVLINPALQIGTPYDLFKFTSAAPALDLDNFILDLPSGVQATLALDSAPAPEQYVTITFQNLGQRIWNGSLAGDGAIWNTTTANWLNPANAATSFSNGNSVAFNDSAAARNVTIAAGNVQPVSIEFTAVNDYSVTGPGKITGTGTMALSGGQVTLTTPSELTGAVTIASGSTLLLGSGGALGTGAIANSGTLAFDSPEPFAIAAPVTGSGVLSHRGSGTTTFTSPVASGSVDIDQGTVIFANTIAAQTQDIATGSVLELSADTARSYSSTSFSGGGTLRKTGTSSVVWVASSATFALDAGALIDVQAGIFTGASSANEVWTDNKSGLHVATGATFDGVEAAINVDALTGTGTIRSGCSGFPDAAIICGVADGSGTFSGAIGDFPLVPNSVGQLIKRGSGAQTLAGTNTYTGNTTVEAGTLILDTTSTLTFKPGVNGVTNRITGDGTVKLDGTIRLNLTTANPTPGNLWNLIDVTTLSESYGDDFTVSDFTEETAGVWTRTEGTNRWTFTQADGNLTLSAAAGYTSWASTHAGNEGPDLDHDGDGVKNGIEYFMGQTGSSFTALPGPVAAGGTTTVTWPRDPAAPVTSFAVQFSTTLASDWTEVPAGEVNLTDPTKVIYTFPAPLTGKRFIRLSVTP